MSGRPITKGTLNVSSVVRIVDSTTGLPETGVVAATAGLAFNYRREGAVAVAITALNNLALLSTAHTDGGILHIGSGYYRIDFQDAAFASGADGVLLEGVATGMMIIGTYHPLFSIDVYDAVRAGLSALPNAAADAAGGVPISDAGGLDMDQLATDLDDIQTRLPPALIGGRIDSNTGSVSGGTVAADNMELDYDGTGYDKVNSTIGTVTALAATALDGIASTAVGMVEIAKAIWDRALTGATHNIATSAGRRLRQLETGIVLDAGTADAATATTIDLETGLASTVDNFHLHNRVVTTGGTGVGQVRIISNYVGASQQATITPPWTVVPDATTTYDVVPGIVHTETAKLGYSGGAVWYDDVGGEAGVDLYVNGTEEKPCSSWADVQTIQTALKLRLAHALPGSTITLDAAYENKEILGAMYSLNLAGFSIDGSLFTKAAHVNGEGLAATNGPLFELCGMETVTLDPCFGLQCSFNGTFTFRTAGSFVFGNSGSLLPNSTAVVFDYNAVINASDLEIEAWTGGTVEIQNAGAGTGTYHLDMAGNGNLIINANCSATTIVSMHGMLELTNNASGLTINQDARYDEPQLVDAVWDEVISKAAHNIAQSSAKILRQSGDLTQIAGSVSDVTPTVGGFDTDLTQPDTFFDDSVLIFTNGAANAGIGITINTYLNANGAVTFDAPDEWPVVPVDGDDFIIFGTHVHPISQIADGVLDELLAGHVIAGSLGKAVIDIEEDTGTTLPAIIDDLAIKKNTAFPNFEFLMVLTSDGRTPATGLVVTGQRSIDGGAFGAVSGVIAEISNGIYQFDALAADTNGDVITWRFLSGTADDTFMTFKTVA